MSVTNLDIVRRLVILNKPEDQVGFVEDVQGMIAAML